MIVHLTDRRNFWHGSKRCARSEPEASVASREFSDGIEWERQESQEARNMVVLSLILEKYLEWQPLSRNQNTGLSPGPVWVSSQMAQLWDTREGNASVP